jgi:hypothetical protein
VNDNDRLFLEVVVLPPVLIAAFVAWLGWMLQPPTPTPIHQRPVSMRCFPEGTILPYRQDFFGNRTPALDGCPDYRLNEGMEA